MFDCSFARPGKRRARLNQQAGNDDDSLPGVVIWDADEPGWRFIQHNSWQITNPSNQSSGLTGTALLGFRFLKDLLSVGVWVRASVVLAADHGIVRVGGEVLDPTDVVCVQRVQELMLVRSITTHFLRVVRPWASANDAQQRTE